MMKDNLVTEEEDNLVIEENDNLVIEEKDNLVPVTPTAPNIPTVPINKINLIPKLTNDFFKDINILDDNSVAITKEDLNLIINLLIIINKRGAFLLDEYMTIGSLYNKFIKLKEPVNDKK